MELEKEILIYKNVPLFQIKNKMVATEHNNIYHGWIVNSLIIFTVSPRVGLNIL